MPNPNPFMTIESAKISDQGLGKPVDAKVLSTNDDMKKWSEVVKTGSASKLADLCLPDFKIEKDEKIKEDGKSKETKEKDKDGKNIDNIEKIQEKNKDKDGKVLIETGKTGVGAGAGTVLEKQHQDEHGQRGGSRREPRDRSNDVKVDLSVHINGEPRFK